MIVNYISAKQTVAEVLTDFNVPNVDKVPRMYDWIDRGLEIMELSDYYVYQNSIKDVKSYRTKLPCDMKFLHSIWIGGNGHNDKGLILLKIRNNPLIGKQVKDICHPSQYGTIDGSYLHTSFERGKVLFIYHAPPKDCDGLPQIPNDAKVKEALPYYIIYRMSLSGYKHPVIDMKTAYNMWEKLYPAAANSVNWMDEQGYQEFAEMWNNMILGDLANNHYMH